MDEDEEFALNLEEFHFDDMIKDEGKEQSDTNPFKKDSTQTFLQKMRENEFDTGSLFNDYLDPKLLTSNVSTELMLDKISAVSAVNGELEKDSKGVKGSASAMDTSKDDAHKLYKASSVPHLHSSKLLQPNQTSPPRRKKTSEANGLPDPVMFNNLLLENQMLKEKIAKEEEERKQIVNINHAWDAQYNLLTQKYATLEREAMQAREELNAVVVSKDKEIASRDKKVTRLAKKLEVFINSCEEDDTSLWEQVEQKDVPRNESRKQMKETPRKDEISETWMKREQASEAWMKMEQTIAKEKEDKKLAIQQAKEFQMKCQYLESALHQQTKQRMYLQTELQRLTGVIEKKHIPIENKKFSASVHEPGLRMPTNSDIFLEGDDLNELELLKQQLQVYAEDFNAEKEDKQKVLKENEELKKKLTLINEEKEHLVRQLQIYEEDFHSEREKRINLMRRGGSSTPVPDEFQTTTHNQSGLHATSDHDAQQQKWREYCCLVVEKEQLADRINELESQGITRYNGRHAAPPTYPHYLPRGRAQPSNSGQLSANMDLSHFYGGNVVRDARSAWPPMYSSGSRAPSESDYRQSTRTNKLQTKAHSPLP